MQRSSTMYDLLIRGGQLIDGSGAPRFAADIAVRNGRIAAIGPLSGATADDIIDAQGQIIAPGFIDVHTHSDGWLLKSRAFAPKLSQGFTTELLGLDGIGYAPLRPELVDEWLAYLRPLNFLQSSDYSGWSNLEQYALALSKTAGSNFALHVPYANVRVLACGWGRASADADQRIHIRREIELGLEVGAVGLSTGLDYVAQTAVSTDELMAACEPLRACDGLYVTHVRYRLGTLGGLREAVEISRRAGVRLHVSHLKGTSPRECDELLEYVDRVAMREVDFSFDIYPYLPGASMLNMLLPEECWDDGPLAAVARLREPEIRARFAERLRTNALPLDRIQLTWIDSEKQQHHEGWTLAEYADALEQPPGECLADLLIDSGLGVGLLFHAGEDRHVQPMLAHPACIVASDGIWHSRPHLHPRVYGTATRLIGPLVRSGLISLETAVHKLTGKPAERFGLAGRGRIAVDFAADLVIFDPSTVGDRATYADPHLMSGGVSHVIVNGQVVFRDNTAIDMPRPCGQHVRASRLKSSD